MSDAPLPGDIRQLENEHLVIDDDEFADPEQPDIGTFDPGVDEDDSDLDAEIDDLPEVGPLDPNEEPILDELEEG